MAIKLTLENSKKTHKRNNSRELGFGNRAYSRSTRLINKGGAFNVEKDGLSFWQGLDTYHELISISWGRFFMLITAMFFGINLLFAILYYLAGPEAIEGARSLTGAGRFLEAFYFSTQTITTVGFGKLNPHTDFVSVLAAIESFLGLLGFALATGLMFARFSRPRKKLIYSMNAIVAPYRDINGLMFRFAHGGKNQLIEAEVEMIATLWIEEENQRTFQPLKLERKKISFFSTSWTVVHPIDKDSPVYGMNFEDFVTQQVEIIVIFKAFDDTYARHIYDRTSYTYKEISWGKKFVSIYDHKDDEAIRIDMDQIGAFEEATLN